MLFPFLRDKSGKRLPGCMIGHFPVPLIRSMGVCLWEIPVISDTVQNSMYGFMHILKII